MAKSIISGKLNSQANQLEGTGGSGCNAGDPSCDPGAGGGGNGGIGGPGGDPGCDLNSGNCGPGGGGPFPVGNGSGLG